MPGGKRKELIPPPPGSSCTPPDVVDLTNIKVQCVHAVHLCSGGVDRSGLVVIWVAEQCQTGLQFWEMGAGATLLVTKSSFLRNTHLGACCHLGYRVNRFLVVSGVIIGTKYVSGIKWYDLRVYVTELKLEPVPGSSSGVWPPRPLTWVLVCATSLRPLLGRCILVSTCHVFNIATEAKCVSLLVRRGFWPTH